MRARSQHPPGTVQNVGESTSPNPTADFKPMLLQELDIQEELPTHGNHAHIFLEQGIAAGLAEA